jgi:hypothetical protein
MRYARLAGVIDDIIRSQPDSGLHPDDYISKDTKKFLLRLRTGESRPTPTAAIRILGMLLVYDHYPAGLVADLTSACSEIWYREKRPDSYAFLLTHNDVVSDPRFIERIGRLPEMGVKISSKNGNIIIEGEQKLVELATGAIKFLQDGNFIDNATDHPRDTSFSSDRDDNGTVATSPTTQPTAPEPSSGATLKPTEEGYDLEQPVYADDEMNDPTNRQVFGHMQGLIKRLDNAMIGLANSHPEFAATFDDYRRQLGQDIAGTNIGGVWLAGAALAEFALALAPDRLTGTMTEAVEPAVLADLRALIVDHKLLTEGFAVGRQMRDRVERFNASGNDPKAAAARSKPVLEAMLKVPNLLAERARNIVDALNRAMNLVGDLTLQTVVASQELSRNAVLAIGRMIYAHETAIRLTVVLGGADHFDALALALVFFRDHGQTVCALASNDSVMRIWIEYIIEAVERNGRKVIKQ